MKKIFYLFIGVVLCTFFAVAVKAALPGDEGLTLSPPLKEITAERGDVISETIKLTNPTSKLVELYPRVMDFNAKGEGGEPGFSEPGEGSEKYSLAKWIKLSQTKIALTTEQVVEYKYQIDVPQDAEPGGHYGVVFFATEPPELTQKTSEVALSSMVGGLVLVTVPGDIRENAKIEEFLSDKIIYLNNQVKFITRIKNLGNVHIKPNGNIYIKNIFGRTVDTLEFNQQKGNVLPESIRKFDNEWFSNKILIGPYRANLNLTYGEAGTSLIASTYVWIFPWWLLIIIGLLLIILVTAVVWRKKKKKKNNIKHNGKKSPQNNYPDSQGPPILR